MRGLLSKDMGFHNPAPLIPKGRRRATFGTQVALHLRDFAKDGASGRPFAPGTPPGRATCRRNA
ncbi:hypothetical protein GCM10007148_27710 [Parvularcula lutaonensis]|nr:hypothetical protein GCM10007148_27710 [Parvularcula lutaonensis]